MPKCKRSSRSIPRSKNWNFRIKILFWWILWYLTVAIRVLGFRMCLINRVKRSRT